MTRRKLPQSNGSAAARRAAQALLAPSRTGKQPDCQLAYGLHEQFGRLCSRLGGKGVCGVCIGDLAPDATDMPCGRMRRPCDGL